MNIFVCSFHIFERLNGREKERGREREWERDGERERQIRRVLVYLKTALNHWSQSRLKT